MRRLVTLGFIVLFLAVLITPTLRNYLNQRSQIESLNQRVTAQQKDVSSLKAQQAQWSNPAYVQRQARERLGFAKPGEKAYIVIDDTAKSHSVTTPSVKGIATDKHTNLPWYGRVWQSTVSAGDNKGVGK